jgi:hypothetical protein
MCNHRVFRLALAFLYPLPRGCVAARHRRADEGQGHFDHFIFSYPIQQFISHVSDIKLLAFTSMLGEWLKFQW